MAADKREGLVVIGACLIRTGTMSLQMALQQLLGGKCYHMTEVMKDPARNIPFWLNAIENDLSDDEWKRCYNNYRAAVAFPTVTVYKRLMQVYPNAKVVLTVRDPHHWIQSVKSTLLPRLRKLETFPTSFVAYFNGMHQLNSLIKAIFVRIFGFDARDKFEDEEMMAEAFRRHVEEVKRHVPPERLLVFDVKEGWEPLCKFLDLPVPPEAFPYVNTRKEFKARRGMMMKRKYLQFGGVVFLTVILGAVAYCMADKLR